MPVPFMIVVAGVLLAVTVTFWGQICDWYSQHARPWIQRHLPEFAPLIHDAFVALDKLASAARRRVRAAWNKIRPHILQAIIEFRRLHDGEWLRRVESFVQTQEGPVYKVTEEHAMAWDELPESVREAALQRRSVAPVDFVQTRDRELLAMEHAG